MVDTKQPSEESRSARISRLEGAVQTLVAGQNKERPFYRSPSQMIAISAFIISVTTAAHSYFRELRQDEASLKTQLRSTLAQSAELRFKYEEIRSKHQNAPAMLEMAQWMGVQNSLLAKQSYELATQLGHKASATELMTVANILRSLNQYIQADMMLNKALGRADNFTERLAALRELGILKTALRQREQADDHFQKAIENISKEQQQPPEYINAEFAMTYLLWSGTAMAGADCKSARERIDRAAQYAASSGILGPAISTGVAQNRDFIASKCP